MCLVFIFLINGLSSSSLITPLLPFVTSVLGDAAQGSSGPRSRKRSVGTESRVERGRCMAALLLPGWHGGEWVGTGSQQGAWAQRPFWPHKGQCGGPQPKQAEGSGGVLPRECWSPGVLGWHSCLGSPASASSPALRCVSARQQTTARGFKIQVKFWAPGCDLAQLSQASGACPASVR